jgi:hypothetical protein
VNASDVITDITYPQPDLWSSPILWMAAGAMLAGVLVMLLGLVGALVGRWLRTPEDAPTAGTAGWELEPISGVPKVFDPQVRG